MTKSSFDLNLNGTIKQQEKGGFLMVNSYGTSYGTEGRAYIPYELFLNGSMKSSNVHGIIIHKEFKPLLTYKATITRSDRNDIEIIRGFSTNISATTPSKTYTYRETFSDGGGSGRINSFPVLDYTGGEVKEYTCTQTEVTISSGITTLSVVCDATKINKGSKIFHATPQFYVSPLTTGSDIIFKFTPRNAHCAVLRVVTIHGRLVYEQPFTVTGDNTFSWDIVNNAGQRVAKDKYIAQIELTDEKGVTNTLYTRFYVMR